MIAKNFRLHVSEIKPLVQMPGGCMASDQITVEGYPGRFMYREVPDNQFDSGWRFMSGFEDDEYMNEPSNLGIYDVNTLANYDPSIIPLLDSPAGSAYEKTEGSEQFAIVADWQPGEA